jgi:hypothetical protein
MPLQGEAKRQYQREYMRRRREMIAEEAAEPWCSFCGKPASEVRVLVRAPTDAPLPAHICDGCARLAAAV